MAATVVFEAPMPPAGQKWCMVCVRLYKGAYLMLETVQARLTQLNGERPSQVVKMKIEFPSGIRTPMLDVAVTESMVTMPFQFTGGQPAAVQAPVCWSHIEGLAVKDGILPASAADMPHGGGVLLGQPR